MILRNARRIKGLRHTPHVNVGSWVQRRVYEHKHHTYEGFTDKYNVSKLVYVESTTDVCAAIAREKQLKRWRRQKKNRLVESINPNWNDLSAQWGLLDRQDFSALVEMTGNAELLL